MALPLPIPPWIVTRPAEHAQASESGLSAGIQAAHIWAQAAQERARIAESQRQQDMDVALKQEALQQKSIYEAQALAVDSARNKAAASMAEAELKQKQDSAARVAQQWSAQHQLAQAREARMGEQWQGQNELARGREARLGEQGQQRLDISRGSAADLARHRLAMENRPTGMSEDAALAAYAKTAREKKDEPGWLGKITSRFLGTRGGPAAPTAPPVTTRKLERANVLAKEHPDWSKEKIIKAVNDEFSTPASNEEPSADEE